MDLIALSELQEGLDRLPELWIGRCLFELREHDLNRYTQLWESHHVRVSCQVYRQALQRFLDDSVLDLLGFQVLFGHLERNDGLGYHLVSEGLWLAVEVGQVNAVEWIQDVLRSWNELACLGVDLSQQFEAFLMERPVLDVLTQPDCPND